VNLGVNHRADLAQVTAEARRQILERHMLDGVTIVDPASTWIDADVQIAPDVTIDPGTFLRGATTVARDTIIGPNSTVIDSEIGSGVRILHSYVLEAAIDDDCTVGPYAYLRPEARLEGGAKAGSFVEIKKSRIGEGAKVPHLSYIGDTEVGAGTNIGAGTITANYDGRKKHQTKIGERARISVNTSLVAPVRVGDDAYTGAGAVIREDVPDGALGVSENTQRNIEGYSQRKASEAREQAGEAEE
jgi:bifunctional UDP-N-acetylglucosamine pyrophosphorylase/glucosamine-1-phosphate N-acetyltransferase